MIPQLNYLGKGIIFGILPKDRACCQLRLTDDAFKHVMRGVSLMRYYDGYRLTAG